MWGWGSAIPIRRHHSTRLSAFTRVFHALWMEVVASSSCAGLTRASIFFARSLYEERWIAGSSPAMTARVSSPRKRGPMITAGGYGSRLSPRFREGRPGRQLLGPGEAPTRGCTKSRLGQFPLFRIDINKGNCNFNVFGLRGPYHPHMSPAMCHHPRNPICHQSSS